MISIRETDSILNQYHDIDFSKSRAALVTVIQVKGSSYRREGARMLVTSDGNWAGGISGGCLEGDALQKAQKAIFNNRTQKVTYNTLDNDPFQIGAGLGCRGVIDVFLEPVESSNAFNAIYFLKKLQNSRVAAALTTIIQSSDEKLLGQRLLLFADGQEFTGLEVGGARSKLRELSENALKHEFSALSTLEHHEVDIQEVFTEYVLPVPSVYLFGHHQDIQPLIEICNTLGWQANIVANTRKLSKLVYEKAKVWSNESFISATSPLPVSFDSQSAVVLMSHDYDTDFRILKRLLAEPIPYIGILGPFSRTENLLQDLNNDGLALSDKDLERIFSPVGLDIGAATPESISLSIAAEIQAFFGKRKGSSLRERKLPIYTVA
jgi:xanthine/CO dehydrogenase XdhC/CoxF family maturation factor